MELPKGTQIKIFLKNGFHYAGRVKDVSEYFLTIHDNRTDKVKGIALSEIANYEVLE